MFTFGGSNREVTMQKILIVSTWGPTLTPDYPIKYVGALFLVRVDLPERSSCFNSFKLRAHAGMKRWRIQAPTAVRSNEFLCDER
jgi:hypothetical protein